MAAHRLGEVLRMLLDIVIVAAFAAGSYLAAKHLSRPRRRGCNRDCTKCGACRQGRWDVKRLREQDND